jgi:DNA-binding response OmpR family regulator
MSTDLSKSILILDDDAIFRGIVHDLLKVRGLLVLEARSAKEADSKLCGYSPALAIVDYRLPESDGVAWITKMRESSRNFPIMFCSGTWCDEKTFNWLRNILRVSMILRKPIDPALFVQQIESLLPVHVLMDAEKNVMEMIPMVVSSLDTKEGHAIKTADESLLDEVKGVRAKLARQQQFAQVRTNYAKELEATWLELLLAVTQAHADVANTVCVSEAIGLAHRIRGTAGTLGFDRIGLCAGKIEDLMRALDPRDTMLGVLWSEIDRAIEVGSQSLEDHVALT